MIKNSLIAINKMKGNYSKMFFNQLLVYNKYLKLKFLHQLKLNNSYNKNLVFLRLTQDHSYLELALLFKVRPFPLYHLHKRQGLELYLLNHFKVSQKALLLLVSPFSLKHSEKSLLQQLQYQFLVYQDSNRFYQTKFLL
jgi:hypothetical protein